MWPAVLSASRIPPRPAHKLMWTPPWRTYSVSHSSWWPDPRRDWGPPKRRALMSLLLFISSFFCFCLLLRPQLPLLLGFTFYLLDLPFLFSRGETGRFISAAFLLCFVSSSWSPPLQLHPVCYSCLHFITT